MTANAELLSLPEVATRLAVKLDTLRRRARAGELDHLFVMVADRRLIRSADLDRVRVIASLRK